MTSSMIILLLVLIQAFRLPLFRTLIQYLLTDEHPVKTQINFFRIEPVKVSHVQNYGIHLALLVFQI